MNILLVTQGTIPALKYGNVDLQQNRRYFHFLGKAVWRLKNVQGAIDIATSARERLEVLGGSRIKW